ncbi:MAG: hypothetical protein ACKOJI_00085, partial [Phycisphaerales bacterium]
PCLQVAAPRGNQKAWGGLAKRGRMMVQAPRGAAWRRRSIDEPGIPTPNVYSLPAVFRMRVVGEAGQ